jgi:hypothetical protein
VRGPSAVPDRLSLSRALDSIARRLPRRGNPFGHPPFGGTESARAVS